MSKSRRTRIVGWAAAFALAVAVSVTQLTPGLAVPPSAGATIDAGTLNLHMSSDGRRFSYVDAGGVAAAPQLITQKQKCTYSSTPTLVDVRASGGTEGFSTGNNQIGVDSRDGSAKCTQVNSAPESLSLQLKNGAGDVMNGLYATHATLDVELKFNPSVTITAYKDGSPTSVFSDTYDCTTSDCGPDRDSGGDNAYITFPKEGTVLFDKLVITASSTGGSTSSAGISLEGGNDTYTSAPAHRDSIFFMAQPAEGTICGGETVTEPTQTGQVSVTNLEDLGTHCKDYLLTYTRDPDTNDRTLTYITGGAGGVATFEVHIFAWDPEPVANPVPPTLVDPPFPSHAGVWCDGTASSPTMPSTPTGEVWCLISQSTSTFGLDAETPTDPGFVPGYGGQLMQVSESWLLEGDANGRR